ncbi:histidine phosphatase family protein [Kribbella sp. VKM Ac-2566]|uniref:histidine phosphatase family protein n=1 Tax=Kribbella sp. VKM Ac-2566 TaxID=2512218 RepID=UPI0010633EC4|nr:histidine phosphatase family protein [Kribbella sp. VKM Ac-2566]TDW86487.1 putative phosphoglycerate mutase [Kribbella sp. VKM Ac-2566]
MSELLLVRNGAVAAHAHHVQLAAQPDLPLNDAGEDQARALRPYLRNRRFGRVLSSPLSQARQTAALAGLEAEPDENLIEWCSVTSSQTTSAKPGLGDRCGTIRFDTSAPITMSGEATHAPTARADHVLAEADTVLADGKDVVLVANANMLQILAARWLGLPALAAPRLPLATGSLSVLGSRRDNRALLLWNFLPRAWPPL